MGICHKWENQEYICNDCHLPIATTFIYYEAIGKKIIYWCTECLQKHLGCYPDEDDA